MIRPCSWLALCLLAFSVVGLSADVLILPNGERLSGNYLGVRDGKIQFETDSLGIVQGDEGKVEVELNAESAFAPYIPPMLSWTPPAQTYVDGTDDAAEVAAEGMEVPDETVAELEPEEAAGGLKGLVQWFLPKGWSGKINLGYSKLNTNTTVESFALSGEASHQVGDNEYIFAGAYDYGQQTSEQGVVTKNTDRYSGRFRWNHALSDGWSLQTRSIYLKDMLREIDHSATQSVGIGYQLIKEEKFELSLTPAIAGRYIEATGFDQHWLGLATLYQSMVYYINHSLRIEQEGTAEYNPGQEVEYAYDIKSALVANITDWVEAGVSYEYNFDNIVGQGADKVEERLLVRVGFPF